MHANAYPQVTLANNIWKTSNETSLDWPSAPLSAFKSDSVAKVTNCILIKSSILSRFDQTTPESPFGNLQGCSYATGFCNVKDGDGLVWDADNSQQCRFLSFASLAGTKVADVWISDGHELALSWNSSAPRIIDCNEKLVITDQGYAIPAAFARRHKRHNTGVVTSNQLSAQLLAVEETQREFTSVLFSHTAKTLCDSFNTYLALTL